MSGRSVLSMTATVVLAAFLLTGGEVWAQDGRGYHPPGYPSLRREAVLGNAAAQHELWGYSPSAYYQRQQTYSFTFAPAVEAQPVPVTRVAPPATVSVVVQTPARPPSEPLAVDLVGPNGQVQTFRVEGGPEAITYRQTTLRPGQSVTIRLTAR